ncbi:MAG: hypothetical protein J0M18_08915, partial [Ignavibacteria bacterium]|nr:hypothetical protein [Ignavibacteria bacterium]
MKILLILLFSIVSLNLFAQDWDDDDEKKEYQRGKYKKDYFSIGLYGGYYLTSGLISQSGATINSVTFEAEYVQTENWAFYAKEICGFFNNDIGNLIDLDELHSSGYTITNYKAPTIMILSGNFGVRYYVRNKNFNPYFQLGLSNEDFYKGEYSYSATSIEGIDYEYKAKQNNHYNHHEEIVKSSVAAAAAAAAAATSTAVESDQNGIPILEDDIIDQRDRLAIIYKVFFEKCVSQCDPSQNIYMLYEGKLSKPLQRKLISMDQTLRSGNQIALSDVLVAFEIDSETSYEKILERFGEN